MSTRLRFSLKHRSLPGSTRLALLLLAVLQFVAPSWHVCDQGGSCCRAHPQIVADDDPLCGDPHCVDPHCRVPRCGDPNCHDPKCLDDDDDQKIVSSTGFALDNPDPVFTGTCLARLLQSMPTSLASTLSLATLSSDYTLRPTPGVRIPAAPAPQQPVGRGPPLSQT